MYNRDLMLKLLIVSSIIAFLSLFTLMPKIVGLAMTMWVLTVFWNMHLIVKSWGLSLTDISDHINNEINNSRKEKKILRKGLYYSIIPMMTVGMICMVMILIHFFLM